MSSSEKSDTDQMLFELAQNEGPDVVHLPYSPDFEAICQQINPKATTEDKHRVWEKLLDLTEANSQPLEAHPSQSSSTASQTNRKPASATNPPKSISQTIEESGLLFPLHNPAPELQP